MVDRECGGHVQSGDSWSLQDLGGRHLAHDRDDGRVFGNGVDDSGVQVGLGHAGVGGQEVQDSINTCVFEGLTRDVKVALLRSIGLMLFL